MERLAASPPNNEHNKRMDESSRINYLGRVVFACAALRLSVLGIDPSDIERFKDEYNNNFFGEKVNRKTRVKILKQQEQLSRLSSHVYNPGSKETNIALHSRRLTLISKVVRDKYAEGTLAVDAVDLFMGRANLNLDEMVLVRQAETL